MYHFNEAITNNKGDALVGYFVKVVDPDTGDTVSIYADESSTPIITESGEANAAKVHTDGNVSFWVASGTYHLDIYLPNATSMVRRIDDMQMYGPESLIDWNVVDRNGADNTGATDCGAAFTAAIASNRRIIVPAGDYTFDTVVSKTGVTDFEIVFMPGVTITKSDSLSNKLFFFNDCHRFRITGSMAKIDDSAAPNPGAGQDFSAIYLPDCEDVEIDHIWFYSGDDYATAGGDSQVFGSGRRIHVHHCKFEGAFDTAVYLSGPSSGSDIFSDHWVRENHFVGCQSACGSKRRLRGVWFADNLVEECLVGFFEGEVDEDETNPLPGQHNIVRSNRFVGCIESAVSFKISTHGTISDNWFINCEGSSIIALQGATRTQIRNNHFLAVSGEYTSIAPQRAIWILPITFDGSTYNSTDNIIEGNDADGIYKMFEESDTSQDRNVFRNNRAVGHSVLYQLRGPKSYYTDATTRKLQGVASGYIGSELVEAQVGHQSTNANLTNVTSIALSEGQSVIVRVLGLGNQSGTASYGAAVQGVFRRAAAGNVTLVGSLVTDAATNFGGAPLITLAADTGSQVVRVQVQGIAATTINWVLSLQYQIVTSNA